MPSYERPDAEEERSPEAEPVSEQFLRELFSSSELLSALEEVGRVTSRRGNESAFAILKALSSSEVHFTKVIEGGAEYTEPRIEVIDRPGFEVVSPSLAIEPLKKKLERKVPRKTFFTFSVFHFHGGRRPGISEVIPSDQDLESTFHFRKENEATTRYDIPPIEMTGSLTQEGEIRIMVYQEPTHYRPLDWNHLSSKTSFLRV